MKKIAFLIFLLLIAATDAEAIEGRTYYIRHWTPLTWFQTIFVNRICPTHGGFKADDGMEVGASLTERTSGFVGYEVRLVALIQGLAWLRTYDITLKKDMTLSDADERKVCLKFRAQRTTPWRTMPNVEE